MTVLDLDKLTPDVRLPPVPFRMKGYDGPTTSTEMTEECKQLAEARAAIQGSYARRPGDVRTLLWRARALDIPVGVAIDHIYINMQGKAGLSAQLIAALLRRAGINWTCVKTPEMVEFTFTKEVWYASRTGKISKRRQRCGTARFELDEARTAGIAGTWYWQKWPVQCMWARAIARAGRELFSDILMGFAYTPEELNDGTSDGATPVQDEDVAAEVTELIEQALSVDATSALIRSDILVRARQSRLLKKHAGDGKSLVEVLARIWQEKASYEADQETAVVADQAMAEAGITAALPPADDSWKDLPIGEGRLPCKCSSAVLLTDVHEDVHEEVPTDVSGQ